MKRTKLKILEKKCTKCKELKSLSNFCKNKNSKDGYACQCKECLKKYQRDNKEMHTKMHKRWREKNKEKWKNALKRWQLKSHYGMTIEQYDTLFKIQDGCCAICGRHQIEFKDRFSVDHDHKTKKVRGLLCNSCNTGIGNLKDSIKLLNKAIKYLTNYKE